VKHFRTIDGLRAWLAWCVVLVHVALYTGADIRVPWLEKIDVSAFYSVRIFIIISGFVITHLLLEKQENYLPFITRRFLRIYPVYFICLCLGIAATYLHLQAFAAHPWGDLVPQPELLAAEVGSLDNGDFLRHLAAHVTMLHGAIANHVLPVSEYMFLGPAWSLSLEWQFYLIAPLIMWALRSRNGQAVAALAAVLAYGAYGQGFFGQFFDPSCLPGAALFFAFGIGSRLLYPKMPEFKTYPVAAMIIAAGFCLMSHELLPYVFWAAFIVWLRTNRDAPVNLLSRVIHAAFDSKTAHFLGVRSYSTYLIHEPIIHTVVFLCIKRFALGLWPTVLITLIVTVATTLAASIVLYRFVEAPIIAYGKRIFKETPRELRPVRAT
jgi:peptidoglycan/LPS O-acetylase OafA/YrhL